MFSLPVKVYWLCFIVALSMSAISMNVLIAGLVGHQLASAAWMATLPVTSLVVGIACGTVPAAKIMQSLGRKLGFLLAIVLCFFSALVAAYAINEGLFTVFCVGTFLAGNSMAFAQQMRFAVAELVNKSQIPLAVSVFMLSGVLAAFVGPELASFGMHWVEGAKYVGSYLLLALIQLLALVLLLFLPLVKPQVALADTCIQKGNSPKDEKTIFYLAVVASVTGFAVMSYIMTATPLSMHHHYRFSLADAKQVIQWHIYAMYLPSLITGKVILNFGNTKSLMLGLLFYGLSIVIAIAGQTHVYFMASLITLGIGWNILITTATSLLATLDNTKLQGQHDFFVFSTQAFATLLAGGMLIKFGWLTILWSSSLAILPLLLLIVLWRRGLP